MEYVLKNLAAMIVAGKSWRVSMKDGENFGVIPEFWYEAEQDGTVERLAASAAGVLLPLGAVLGVCADFSPDMAAFTYMIAAERGSWDMLDGDVPVSVPASRWACFDAVGPPSAAVQSVWKRIWSEFFDVTEYKHGEGPDIEVYPPGDTCGPAYRSTVMVPVVKK